MKKLPEKPPQESQIQAPLEEGWPVSRDDGEHSLSQARLREVVDHTSDIILVVRVEPDGRFVYEDVNRTIEKFGGDPARYRAGTETPHDIYPKAFADQIVEHYQECIDRRQHVAHELSRVGLNGMEFTFLTTVVPILDSGGSEIVRLIVFGHDITEQKRAEGALRARESRFRKLVQNLNDIIVV